MIKTFISGMNHKTTIGTRSLLRVAFEYWEFM